MHVFRIMHMYYVLLLQCFSISSPFYLSNFPSFCIHLHVLQIFLSSQFFPLSLSPLISLSPSQGSVMSHVVRDIVRRRGIILMVKMKRVWLCL